MGFFRLGALPIDPGKMAVSKSFATGVSTALQALNIGFPGMGAVVSFLVGKLFGSNAEEFAEKKQHIFDNVVTPIVNAAKSGNYSSAVDLVTMSPNAQTHVNFIYSYIKQAIPAVNVVVLGDAIQRGDFAKAQRYASLIDQVNAVAYQNLRIAQENVKKVRVGGDDGGGGQRLPVYILCLDQFGNIVADMNPAIPKWQQNKLEGSPIYEHDG